MNKAIALEAALMGCAAGELLPEASRTLPASDLELYDKYKQHFVNVVSQAQRWSFVGDSKCTSGILSRAMHNSNGPGQLVYI